ncbi:LOB domain-containing protein 37-like [Rhodamnia argentea]|uniref:LOB domain-containing protein 37-like n=1 Tax=Rhodamnia argentea TaxID=178133 RepID=A0A8B8R220_9MYRT|nr:LOB domain-containing protein 37-like [Rhodamnia argentea]
MVISLSLSLSLSQSHIYPSSSSSPDLPSGNSSNSHLWMSCNGCRVLRKGCSDGCMLRQCLHLIDSPQAQAHATLFVAKFFGRAALMSFVSAVPAAHRPALFQSLLFEAVGRTINPVGGAVGLIRTGNWRLCQSAVDTVLRGGALHALPEPVDLPSFDLDRSSASGVDHVRPPSPPSPPTRDEPTKKTEENRLDLSLMSPASRLQRPTTPSEEESETTTTWRSGSSESGCPRREAKLLTLFV